MSGQSPHGVSQQRAAHALAHHPNHWVTSSWWEPRKSHMGPSSSQWLSPGTAYVSLGCREQDPSVPRHTP